MKNRFLFVGTVLFCAALAVMGCPNPVEPDTTPPTIAALSVEESAPNVLRVTFSEPVTVSSFEGFTSGNTRAATAVSAVAGSGKDWRFTLSDEVVYGDTVTLAYTKPATPNVTDEADNALESFSARAVTNNRIKPSTLQINNLPASYKDKYLLVYVYEGETIVATGFVSGATNSITITGANMAVLLVDDAGDSFDSSSHFTGAGSRTVKLYYRTANEGNYFLNCAFDVSFVNGSATVDWENPDQLPAATVRLTGIPQNMEEQYLMIVVFANDTKEAQGYYYTSQTYYTNTVPISADVMDIPLYKADDSGFINGSHPYDGEGSRIIRIYTAPSAESDLFPFNRRFNTVSFTGGSAKINWNNPTQTANVRSVAGEYAEAVELRETVLEIR